MFSLVSDTFGNDQSKVLTHVDAIIGQTRLEHEFEQRFWDFDDKLIEAAQFFHLQQDKPCRRIMGGIIVLIGAIIQGAFNQEILMTFILSLSILQQDFPVRLLCHMMVLNIVVTQGLKRCFHRPRPVDFHPTAPRAKKLMETDKLGGLPSNLITLATTFTFAVLTIDTWAKEFAPLNSIEAW